MAGLNLISESWHSLKIENTNFLFKFFTSEKSYEFLLMNFNTLSVYSGQLAENEILQTLKDLNHKMESPIVTILNRLKECLIQGNQEGCSTFSFKIDDDKLQIVLVSKIKNLPFNWRFDLKAQTLNFLRDHFFTPLLFNVHEFQTRENELVSLIQKKDKEIEDYKSQNVKLQRNYLETEVFSKEAFDKKLGQKVECEDLLSNPEKSLCSPQFAMVHKSCVDKYLVTISKKNVDPAVSPKKKRIPSHTDDDLMEETQPVVETKVDKKVEKTNEEKTLSRKEQLALQLAKEEAAKKTAKDTKKTRKLF